MLGQFAIHLATMMYLVSMAKEYMPANWAVRSSEDRAGSCRRFAGGSSFACRPDACSDGFPHPFSLPLVQPNIEGKFEPNLINSVVFLVSLLQQVRWGW